jgi:glutamate-1-semialdehyde 2,1-aminomutase
MAHDLTRAIKDAGALLIFDESKTGFRVHLGGFQALYDVAGDLTVLSKALANGLPLAVVLGRRDLIALAQRARIKGTFGAETASIAAALATVETLAAEDAPRVLNETGTQLINGLNEVITSVGLQEHVSAVPYHWACMPYIRFTGSAQPLEDAFFFGLVRRGVLMLRDHMSYVSLALTTADVNRVMVAAHGALLELVGGA